MSKAILFDLDGTLTDSGEGIINCASFALEHFGLAVPDRNAMRVFVGPPLRDTFIRFGVPADLAEEAIAVFRSRYLPIGIYENTPYPGVHDLLHRLQSEGCRLFVATSKPESMALSVLNRFDLARYFEVIAGATLDGARDEKSQVIDYLLSLVGKQADAVMVGDTVFDVIGASEHGIPTIGVAWGYGKPEDMQKAGAIAVANSTEELYQLLTKEKTG